MTTAVRRAVWFAALALVLSLELGVWAFVSRVEVAYAHDFIVVQHAEPWRTACRILAMLFATVLVARAALRPPGERCPGCAVGSLLFSLAVSIELAGSTNFDNMQGYIEVDALPLSRGREHFPMGESGWCVDADFTNPFVWRLNGKSVYPRLLPLPLTSDALIRRLSEPTEGCPGRK